MQICLKCGKAIKYIATGFKTIQVCDAEKIEIVSEGGHILKGYMRHICAAEKQGKQNEKE
ncbi:hypothetical protein E4N71_11275 [Treponema vincentii]|uniref:hypothetical protein n=1 Tax=Treponema vincentii TaxID=69710 RepID=UPI003D8C9660